MSFLDAVNPHSERHTAGRAGWLRAAVLGANDGLVSTASLMVGVAASSAAIGTVLTAGLAGLAAGSMAMAAGEYVSVSSQVDVENADRAKETRELAENPQAELNELVEIYKSRGVPSELANKSRRPCMNPIHWRPTYATNSVTPRPPPRARCRPPPPQQSASWLAA